MTSTDMYVRYAVSLRAMHPLLLRILISIKTIKKFGAGHRRGEWSGGATVPRPPPRGIFV